MRVELTPISVASLVVLGLLYLLYKWLLPHPLQGIPYDEKSAGKLLGDTPDMLREVSVTREIHVWLLKKVNQFQEPLCQVFIEPFCRPWVVLADPVEAQNVLTRRPEFDRSGMDKIGLSPLDGFHSRHDMGEVWKTARAWVQDLASPSFHNNTVSPILYESSLLLLEYWDTKARLAKGRPFDVASDIDHLSLDGQLSFVFDEQFKHAALNPQIRTVAQLDPSSVTIGRNGEATFPHGPLNKFVAAMHGTVDAVTTVAASVWPKLGEWWVRQIPKFSKAAAVRRQVIDEQVQRAVGRFEATGEAKTAIEYMLMREKKAAEKQGRKPDYENKILRDEVRFKASRTTLMSHSRFVVLLILDLFGEQIGGQFLAGYHTSASTLSWMLIHLTRSQQVQVKLRDALHTAYGAAHAERRTPSHAELSKSQVPYLDAVINEVLRLHATILSRTAVRDTQLLGHHIPKGTLLLMLCNGPGYHSPSFDATAAQRSASGETDFSSSWDETHDMFTFEPERWLHKKEKASTTPATEDDAVEFNANAVPQHAFGMGIRGCWGRKLANLQLRTWLTLVVWHFDLLPVAHALNNTTAALSVIHRSDACYVRLRRRGDACDLSKE